MPEDKQSDSFKPNTFQFLIHDLKSPLGLIKNLVDLIGYQGELNEQQTETINKVMDVLMRTSYEIDFILDLISLKNDHIRLDRSPVQIQTILEDNIENLHYLTRLRNIQLHFEVREPVSAVEADIRFLQHVFVNLIENAIKYNVRNGEVWIILSQQGEFVRVDVKDTGKGLSEEHRDQIFDQYFRVEDLLENKQIQGNGLGLAIVMMIVKMHNGYVHVESELGQGSVFSVTLPVHYVPQTEAYALEDSDAINDQSQESSDRDSLGPN